jgi:hypothetical protein
MVRVSVEPRVVDADPAEPAAAEPGTVEPHAGERSASESR